MRYLAALLLAAAALGVDPEPVMADPARQVFGARGPAALAVPCPRCGAPAGTACDRRTLGRHLAHAARVAALESAR